jgi:hypothetical protein
MFQAAFINTVAKPPGCSVSSQLTMYNKGLGRPPLATVSALFCELKAAMSVSSWSAYFRKIRVPLPSPDSLACILKKAVRNSMQKGYFVRMNATNSPLATLEDVPFCLIVSGAGTAHVNGRYFRTGVYNDAPTWENIGSSCVLYRWHNQKWFLSRLISPTVDPDFYACRYTTGANVVPPTSRWLALGSGQAPVPIITVDTTVTNCFL